jgi:adenylyltransferase/sulfurtransferase
VLGATPGVVGCLEAMEALKHLTGVGEALKGKLLVWSGDEMEFLTYPVAKDPDCPSCSAR